MCECVITHKCKDKRSTLIAISETHGLPYFFWFCPPHHTFFFFPTKKTSPKCQPFCLCHLLLTLFSFASQPSITSPFMNPNPKYIHISRHLYILPHMSLYQNSLKKQKTESNVQHKVSCCHYHSKPCTRICRRTFNTTG